MVRQRQNEAEAGVPAPRERRSRRAMLLFSALFALCIAASFLLGKYPVTPGEFLGVLGSRLFHVPKTWSDAAETVILEVRMPRVAAAALIGAALSCAGAAYQSIFKNPMVSPDIMGASAGAGFGAALGIMLSLGFWGISVCSFLFGLGAVAVSYCVGTCAKSAPTLALVLAGIMVGSLFQACTSFLKLIADPADKLPAITYWLMGSLASIRRQDILLAAVPIAAGISPVFLLRWRLNVLAMGDEEARALGVHAGRLRLVVVCAATLSTSACVAVSGMVGWIGLVMPHLARMAVGSDNRRLVPASILLGGSFLLAVDDIARLIATSEIPLGILTSFAGAPFFLFLILRRRGQA